MKNEINSLPSVEGIIAPPIDGWKANTIYLVRASWGRHSPVERYLLSVDNPKDSTNWECWKPNEAACMIAEDCYYLEVEKELTNLL